MANLSCSSMLYKQETLWLRNEAFSEKIACNFQPSSAVEKVSIVCGTNKHVKSEMLSNRHTHIHTDQVL